MVLPGWDELSGGRPRVLLIHVNGSYFDIDKGGLNVGVAHEAHEGGKTHTGTHHIGGEGMSEAMRVGFETPVVRR
jgi:hypothetical protein